MHAWGECLVVEFAVIVLLCLNSMKKKKKEGGGPRGKHVQAWQGWNVMCDVQTNVSAHHLLCFSVPPTHTFPRGYARVPVLKTTAHYHVTPIIQCFSLIIPIFRLSSPTTCQCAIIPHSIFFSFLIPLQNSNTSLSRLKSNV